MNDSFITAISTSIVTSGIIVWLLQNGIGERLKNKIKHEYDAKLESHKSQLKHEYDAKLETHKAQLKADLDISLEAYKAKISAENATAIERLKAELQIAASEHQIRFANLHEKVAKVVAGTYARLYRLREAIQRYGAIIESSNTPPKKEQREAAGQAMKDFHEYFLPRRLYLPKDLANRIKSFDDKLYKVALGFKRDIEEDEKPGYTSRVTWADVDKVMTDEVRPMFDELEDEFRNLLGVCKPTDQSASIARK